MFAAAALGQLLMSCSESTVTPPSAPTPVTAALLGPVVGNVGPTSAVVWTRADRVLSLSARFSTDPAMAGYSVSSPVVTASINDFTAKLMVSGLLPRSTYYYDVLVDGVSLFEPPYPRFTTFANPDETTDFKFVMLTDFCCSGFYDPPPTPIFDVASREDPAFVLIGGDFDHRNAHGTSAEDARNLKRQMFRELYGPSRNMNGFVQGILRRYAVAHLWDDHDYASNNSDKSYRFKTISLEVLNEYFPAYPLGARGDWQRFRYGQAEFFLLDSRSQRDHSAEPDGPDKSMLDGDNLGATGQLQWLKDGLRTSSATWKFLVSPVVFNPTVPKRDGWAGYSWERAEIIDFVRQHRIRNVVVISGDIHAGAIDAGEHSTFPEIAVPAANLTPTTDASCLSAPGSGLWSVGFYGDNSMSLCPGYAVVTVLANPDRVVLEIKDENGRRQLGQSVSRSD
jgi:alkaline phosphatase D